MARVAASVLAWPPLSEGASAAPALAPASVCSLANGLPLVVLTMVPLSSDSRVLGASVLSSNPRSAISRCHAWRSWWRRGAHVTRREWGRGRHARTHPLVGGQVDSGKLAGGAAQLLRKLLLGAGQLHEEHALRGAIDLDQHRVHCGGRLPRGGKGEGQGLCAPQLPSVLRTSASCSLTLSTLSGLAFGLPCSCCSCSSSPSRWLVARLYAERIESRAANRERMASIWRRKHAVRVDAMQSGAARRGARERAAA